MEQTSAAVDNTAKPRPSSSRTHNQPPKTSSLARHERLCSICQHPQREDIDDDILRWRSPDDIACEFKLGDRSTIYRHGRALNLFTQRTQNLNPALERVIESVYDAKPSAGVILKAMAIYARINGNDAFNDPPKRTIITHITVNNASASTPNPATNENPADSVGAPPCPEVRACPEPPKDAAPSSNLQPPQPPLETVKPTHSSEPEQATDHYRLVRRVSPILLAFLMGWLLASASPLPSISHASTSPTVTALSSRTLPNAGSMAGFPLLPLHPLPPAFYPPHELTVAKPQLIQNTNQSRSLLATKTQLTNKGGRAESTPLTMIGPRNIVASRFFAQACHPRSQLSSSMTQSD